MSQRAPLSPLAAAQNTFTADDDATTTYSLDSLLSDQQSLKKSNSNMFDVPKSLNISKSAELNKSQEMLPSVSQLLGLKKSTDSLKDPSPLSKSQSQEIKSQSREIKTQGSEVQTQSQEVKPQSQEVKSQIQEVQPETQDVKPQSQDVQSQTSEVKPQTSEAQEVKPQSPVLANKDIKPVIKNPKPDLNRLPSQSLSGVRPTLSQLASLNAASELTSRSESSSPMFKNTLSMFESQGSMSSLAGPSEVKFLKESTDSLVAKEKNYSVQAVKASLEDFKSVDNLISQLDQVKKLEKPAISSDFLNVMKFETPEQQRKNKEAKAKEAKARLEESQVTKSQVRVYVESDQNYKTIQVTSLQTVPDVTASLIEKANLQPNQQWTLFEYLVELGIVRPLREFEYVTEVVNTWKPETKNALLIKPYNHKQTLSAVSNQKTSHKGTMFVQFGDTWKKVQCVLQSDGLFYTEHSKTESKDVKLSDIEDCDVYYTMKPRKKAPHKFCFAIKSGDDCRHFSIDTQEKLDEWVLCILSLKTQNIVKPPVSGRRVSRFALPGLAGAKPLKSPVIPTDTKPQV